MAATRKLDPHDPIPETGRHVVLLRRFEEDDPRRVMLELLVSRGHDAPELTQPVRADGTAMGVREALQLARDIADREQLPTVYVIDRLAGARERDILRHDGDHTVHMSELDDFDLEEGERGSDMRDRQP